MCNIKHRLVLLLLEIQPWEKPRVDIVPLDAFVCLLGFFLLCFVFSPYKLDS